MVKEVEEIKENSLGDILKDAYSINDSEEVLEIDEI